MLPATITDLDTIRENQRFETYKARYEGQEVFVKQVRHPKLADRIRREIWGIQAFTDLGTFNQLPFEVPKILLSGSDFLVTSWAYGDPMRFAPSSQTFAEEVEFFATSLAAIDKLTQFAHPMQSKFDTPGPPEDSLQDRLRSRLARVPYTQYFDQQLIDKCFDMLGKKLHTLEARLTHADFTPDNVLEYQEKRTLIDFESTNFLWPRFYDLVNLTYNRIIMRPELTTGCIKLIERYFAINDAADIKVCAAQMNTIAMVRSLSMIDELMSKPDFYHNTQQEMTLETAERLSSYMNVMLNGEVYFEVKV